MLHLHMQHARRNGDFMQQKNAKTLSIAQYAKLRGLNRSTIDRQIKQGKIPSSGGRIDPIAADRARERNLNPARREEAARRKETVGRPVRPAAVAVRPAAVDPN